MEDLINEQILERLYEEALDELTLKEFSYWLRSATSNKSYEPNSKEFMDKETNKSSYSVSMEGQLYDFGSCYLCWGNENDE